MKDLTDLRVALGPARTWELIDRAIEAASDVRLFGDVATPADGRPVCDLANVADLFEQVQRTSAALSESNGEAPDLFTRPEGGVTVARPDGEIEDLRTLAAVRGEVACRVRVRGQNGPIHPPRAVCETLALRRIPELPVLRRVYRVPVITPDGRLISRAGFDPSTGWYVALTGGDLAVPTIPRPVSRKDLGAAVSALWDVFAEFPLTDESSWAHLLGLLLTLIGRPVLGGALVPLHWLNKPEAGTGSTLLLRAVSEIALGREFDRCHEARDDAEWEKRITAVLIKRPAMVVIDNANRLQSGVLADVLTAPRWGSRLLGSSTTVDLPVEWVLCATSNNLQLTTEIGRRAVPVRLDAEMARPWERDTRTFRYPDLLAAIRERRPELVRALAVLWAAWFEAGRPKGARTMGSFETWATTIGGVLDVCGVAGFLARQRDVFAMGDAGGEAFSAFVHRWWAKFGTEGLRAADLLEVVDNPEPLELGIDVGRADVSVRVKRLAGLLRRWAGRYVDLVSGESVRVARARVDSVTNSARWCLEVGRRGNPDPVNGTTGSSYEDSGSTGFSGGAKNPPANTRTVNAPTGSSYEDHRVSGFISQPIEAPEDERKDQDHNDQSVARTRGGENTRKPGDAANSTPVGHLASGFLVPGFSGYSGNPVVKQEGGSVEQVALFEAPAPVVPELPAGFEVVRTVERLAELAASLRPDVLGIDTETRSLDQFDPAGLVGISIAWGENVGAYLPIASLDVELARHEVAEFFRVLDLVGVRFVFWHGEFDRNVLGAALGWMPAAWDDALIAYRLATAGLRVSHGLKAAAGTVLGRPARGTFADTFGDRSIWMLPAAAVARYAIADACETLALWRSETVTAAARPKLYALERDTAEIVRKGTAIGWHVDGGRCAAELAKLDGRIAALRARVADALGPINPASPRQVVAALAAKGITVEGTSEEVLSSVEAPGVADLLAWREAAKFRKLIETFEGREVVRLRIKSLGTETGRMAGGGSDGRDGYVRCNVQALPKARSKDAVNVRAILRPAPVGDEAWCVLAADYSQIEPRILADLSGEPTWIQAYRDGEDLYLRMASQAFGESITDRKDPRRQVSKVLLLAIAYGATAAGLAPKVGMSVEDVERLIANLYAAAPRVLGWQREAQSEAFRTGTARTAFGRVRLLERAGGGGHAERVAVNTPIQGTAADVLKMAIRNVDRALDAAGLAERAQMVCWIHDEIDLRVRRDVLGDVAAILRREMESVPGPGGRPWAVPLVAELSYGANLGELDGFEG